MKVHKLLVVGAMMGALVVPTKAAVYGTLKQDMYFNIEGNPIVKASGTDVSILDEDVDHYLIRVDKERNDLVSKHFVKISGTITTTKNTAAIVEMPNSEAEVLVDIAKDEIVMALAKEGEFYKVKVNDTVGYIYCNSLDESKLVDLIEENGSSKGKEIVAYAKQFLGGRYIYGGNSLTSGVDCSGFTQQVMKHFGIAIERSSRTQYACNGYHVSEAEIQPGDLVFYGYSTINHVAIYAGDGMIIHANNENTGIIMSDLHYGNKSIIGIKRVI